MVGFALLAPAAFVAPFASGLADRFRRDRVLAWGHLVQSLVHAATGLAMLLSAPELVVYLVGVVSVSTLTVTRPALWSLLPWVTSRPEELTGANVTGSFVDSMGRLIGPAVAGLILLGTGPGFVFVSLAGLLAMGTVTAFRVDAHAIAERAPRNRFSSPVSRIRPGADALLNDRGSMLIFGLLTAGLVVLGGLDVAIVIAAADVLDRGGSTAGFLGGAIGVGSVAGSVAAVTLIGRRVAPTIGVGVVLLGFPIALMAGSSSLVVALVLMAASGVGTTLMEVGGRSLLQRRTRDDVLARVFGLLESSSMFALASGSLLVSAVVAVGSSGLALVVLGCFLPILAVAMLPGIVALERLSPPPERELVELITSVPMFASLPAPVVEQIVVNLEPVALCDAAPLMEQGESGDRFYVVSEGELDVERDGILVSTLERGDPVGEIALLHDTARTATVRARGDAVVLGLPRDVFLSAVTGHPHSRDEAEAIAAARLNG